MTDTADFSWFFERVTKFESWLQSHPEIRSTFVLPTAEDVARCGRAPTIYFTAFASDPELSDAESSVLNATRTCLKIIAKGVRAYIRRAPEAETRLDPQTGLLIVCSYVRFRVSPEHSSWIIWRDDRFVKLPPQTRKRMLGLDVDQSFDPAWNPGRYALGREDDDVLAT